MYAAKTLLFLLLSTYAYAADEGCPSTQQIRQSVADFQAKTEKLQKNLDLFVAGKGPLELLPNMLFTIDFNDPEAVSRRVDNLREAEKSGLENQEPFAHWLKCAKVAPKNEQKTITELIFKTQEAAQILNQTRLKFLTLPEVQKSNLLRIQEENAKQAQALIEINKTQTEAAFQRNEAQRKVEEAEELAEKSQDQWIKQLATDRAILEKYKEELAQLQLNSTTDQEERIKKYLDLTKVLASLAARPTHETPANTLKSYTQATEIWRTLVDDAYVMIAGETNIDIPRVPKHATTPETDQSEIKSQFADYSQSYEQAQKQKIEIEKRIGDMLNREKEIMSSLLLKSGAVRAQLFQNLLQSPSGFEISVNSETIDDLIREVKVIPFRPLAFFISKSVDFKQKISSGIAGWIEIGHQLFLFILVIMMPIGFYFGLQSASRVIDGWRRHLISKSTLDYRIRTRIAIWINRLNPYFPWVMMLLAAEWAKSMLESAELKELGLFIPYLEIYLFYRISRRGLSQLLANFFIRGNLEALNSKQTLVQSSARRLTRLFFGEILLLHVTQDAVRRAIIYTLASNLVLYINVAFVLFEFNRWKLEIRDLAVHVLAPRYTNLFHRHYETRYYFLLNPLLFALAVTKSSTTTFLRWLSQFDFAKRISAELFRKKLEEKAEETGSTRPRSKNIPEDYQLYFDVSKPVPNGALVPLSRTPTDSITNTFEKWRLGDAEEDALILYGDKGMGKTSLLRQLEDHVSSVDCSAIFKDVPPKLTTAEDTFKFVSDAFKKPISNPLEFLVLDQNRPKTLFILDNAQNFFLAKRNGLHAYRALLDLMNLQTKNIYWCLAYNRRSWDYLRGVFGENHYYGKALEIRRWTDAEIQQLILKRHQLSGYRMAFDSIITATQKVDSVESLTEVEAQFFRLLWGQSRGNPRAALVLWLSALRFLGDSHLKVSLPEFAKVETMAGLSDEALFVYAAIVRHENLLLEEITGVTNISTAVVKKAVKQGEAAGLLRMGHDSRIRVTPAGQYVVNNYLLGKNFIYE